MAAISSTVPYLRRGVPYSSTRGVVPWSSRHGVVPRGRASRMGRLGAGATLTTGEQGLTAIGIGQGGVGGAVHGAESGATIGSAVGPLGAGIGAAIGAIAGGLIHTSQQPQRVAAANQMLAQLQALPNNFQGRTLTLPVLSQTFGSIVTAKQMFGSVPGDPASSPSDQAHEFQGFMDMIAALLQQMNRTPIGAPINFSYNGWNGVRFTFQFTNPGSASSAIVTQQVVIPAMIAWLTHNGTQDVATTTRDANNPYVQTVFQLMTDYQIAQFPPPNAPAPTTLVLSQPGAPQPAPPVAPINLPPPVQAAPQIIPQQAPINVSVAAPSPQYMPAPVAASGMSPTTILLIGGVILAIVFLTKK